MIKNIIFDLGNVLLKFKPEEFLLRYSTDKEFIQDFIFKVIRSPIWLNLDRGTISIEDAKNIFITNYPDDNNLIELFFSHWMEMLTPINENVKILQDLKSNGYKIYVLSNFIKEAFDYVQNHYEFFSIFDGKIISCKINVVKPEPKIYDELLDKFHLNPKECVFIDDIKSFLTYAKKLDMKTILHLPHTDLRSELQKLGVVI